MARGEIDQETADLYLAYALLDYDSLPEQYRSDAPWDGTIPLLELRERTAAMQASAIRARVEALLTGICSTSTGSLPNVHNSTHFHIEYDTIGGGLTINSYANSLETAWTQEVTTFGWAAPPVLTSNPPPGNRYHVRIDNLGSGLYGYVSSSGTHAGFVGNNPNTAWDDGDAYATCMVLNRDYTGFPGSPQQALDATTAHEFNHSIQFGYGALTGSNAPDVVFIEGGATWMEDEVYDSANDNYNYLWPNFTMCMGEYTDSPYPYWITLRGLTEQYGTGSAGAGEQVMQDFWELTSQSGSSNMFTAINQALVNKGTTLADAYHAYAIAVKFLKTCGGGYVYPYCFEEASGYTAAAGIPAVHGTIGSIGGSYSGSVADNYALNWIALPTGSVTYSVVLTNTSGGGTLRGSIVCDTSAALQVTPFPSTVGAGGFSAVANYNPSGCSSVVAVITNQAQTSANPSSCTARSYTLRVLPSSGGANHWVYLPLVARPCVVPSIPNGNFESGATAWSQYSTHGWPLIIKSGFPGSVRPHSGSWAVWLGGDYNDISYIQQSLAIPACAPYLSYYHWIASQDVCGYDFGGVIINGTTVVDVYTLCTSTNTGGWVKHVVNLSAYAGQTVSLQIRAETDGSLNSNLFVDDVAFQKSATAREGIPVILDPAAAQPRCSLFNPAGVGEEGGQLLQPLQQRLQWLLRSAALFGEGDFADPALVVDDHTP